MKYRYYCGKGNRKMNSHLIRLAWSVVDKTPIPQRSDFTLEDRLSAVLSAVEEQISLSPQERQQVQQYLTSRQHLLIDLYR